MALTISRRSIAGRPPLRVPLLGLGSNGSRRSHCASVRSVGYGLRVMPDTTNQKATAAPEQFSDTL